MQTFLPYPDFYRTAECLDFRRLGKQRVEAMQIINVLEEKSFGWRSHPVHKYTPKTLHALSLSVGKV